MAADGFGVQGVLLRLAQRERPHGCIFVDRRARQALGRLQLSVCDLADAVFESVAEPELLVECSGRPAWEFVAILLKFVDLRLPGAQVHFGPAHPSDLLRVLRASGGRSTLRQGDRVLLEFGSDVLKACRSQAAGDVAAVLKQTFFEECSGELVVPVSVPLCHSHTPVYMVNILMMSGELFDTLRAVSTQTVGMLLVDVAESVSGPGGVSRLDCIVLPPFARRAASLGDLFRFRRASLVSSSRAALETRLVELGASVLVHDDDVITVTAVLKSAFRDRSRSPS